VVGLGTGHIGLYLDGIEEEGRGEGWTIGV
jgi:hypothetical protein